MIFVWQALAVAQNMVTLHRSADLLSSTNIKPSCSTVSRQLAANYSRLKPRVDGTAVSGFGQKLPTKCYHHSA